MSEKPLNNNNKTGFKVPKDYFQNLEDMLLSNIKTKPLPSDPGFKTPKHYFETFEDRIIEKTLEEKSPKTISIFSKQNLIYLSGIAAAVLLLLTLTLFNNKPQWDNLDSETVENYIIEENLGSYEIAALLLEDSINEEEFIDFDLKEEHIESYLLDFTDIEDLIIEKNNQLQ